MLLALLIAAQVAAPDVVVTGKRLEALHERCEQGGCSPLRDAQVSIAWAEAQFRDGKYVAAKRTLAGAASRNKRHAAAHPRPVAAIYEAYATVSWQEGDQRTYRDAVVDRVRTLQANLPADDPHVRGAALAMGDMGVKVNQLVDADRAYARAGREALAAGRNDVALRATMARARLAHMGGDNVRATALLTEAEALPGAGAAQVSEAIAAMRARVAAVKGDRAVLDRLVGARRAQGSEQPALVWGPPLPRAALDLVDPARLRGRNLMGGLAEAPISGASQTAEMDTIQWIDVGFRIRPDGRTAEVELLRGSRGADWAAPYLAQIAGRRYTAVGEPDGAGTYRIERFTVRGNYKLPIGSLIRRRAGVSKLAVIDMTAPDTRVTAVR